MPKFSKHEVIARLSEIGLLPVFYNEDIEVADEIVRACNEGGAKIVEFTNRGDFAFEIFSKLAKKYNEESSEVILGVGTIVDPSTANLYVNCGANFIVGPVFNANVSKACNRRKVPYIPGCSTPSEIYSAEEMGADIVKVFPASTVGTSFIKSVLGPRPRSKLMPSGGVKATRDDISAWFEAGAIAVNIGTDLIRKDLVKAKNFEGIRRRVEKCISWIKESRRVTD